MRLLQQITVGAGASLIGISVLLYEFEPEVSRGSALAGIWFLLAWIWLNSIPVMQSSSETRKSILTRILPVAITFSLLALSAFITYATLLIIKSD